MMNYQGINNENLSANPRFSLNLKRPLFQITQVEAYTVNQRRKEVGTTLEVYCITNLRSARRYTAFAEHGLGIPG